MKIVLGENAWDDCLRWQAADGKMLLRLDDLIREWARTPFTEGGKPEPLKGRSSG